MPTAHRAPGKLTLAAFAMLVTLGGANFVAVRTSNKELAPLWGAGLRFALAAVLFTALAAARRLRWPRGRVLAHTVLYGVLGFAVSYALLYWALVRVTAGVATVVLAAVPLATLLLAVAQRLERMSLRAAVGGVLAVVGIAWMSLGTSRVALPLSALVALVAAVLAIGQSVILAKRLASNDPVVTNAVGMLAGAALLLAASAVAGETWLLPRRADVVWSVVYLVLPGSIGLFLLVLFVVRAWTASASSYAFVLFPVVTLALGALLTDEPVTARAAVGAALVMAGVWFGALSAPRPSAVT